MANSRQLDERQLDNGDDARIKLMLEAVQVPVELNERVKSRLREALMVDGVRLTENIEQDSAAETTHGRTEREGNPTTTSIGRGRRALLMMAMAAALAGLAFLANQWRQPNEREWLVKQCHSILDNWEQDNPANLEVGANLSSLPPSVRQQLAGVSLLGSRPLAALGSKFKGTLYRLHAADGRSLVLMRLAELPAVRGLNSRFYNLHTPSGGWSLFALQVNNETFVLAAQCTEQELMNYIRRPVVT